MNTGSTESAMPCAHVVAWEKCVTERGNHDARRKAVAALREAGVAESTIRYGLIEEEVPSVSDGKTYCLLRAYPEL